MSSYIENSYYIKDVYRVLLDTELVREERILQIGRGKSKEQIEGLAFDKQEKRNVTNNPEKFPGIIASAEQYGPFDLGEIPLEGVSDLKLFSKDSITVSDKEYQYARELYRTATGKYFIRAFEKVADFCVYRGKIEITPDVRATYARPSKFDPRPGEKRGWFYRPSDIKHLLT